MRHACGARRSRSGRLCVIVGHLHVDQVVKLWRADLSKINPRAAEALADPAQYSNLFPNMDLAIQAEQHQVSLLVGSERLHVPRKLPSAGHCCTIASSCCLSASASYLLQVSVTSVC